jgi:hypothetical protein
MTPPDTEFARLRDLEDKPVAMPAFTLAGMRAKAMVRVCLVRSVRLGATR